ncbi:MAG: GAF domain-containing protein, partial [Chloroflexota bacterium]
MGKTHSGEANHFNQAGSHSMLSGLQAASAALRRSGGSESDVLHAFRDQAGRLGWIGLVCLFDESSSELVVQAAGGPGGFFARLEKQARITLEGHRFHFGGYYQAAVEQGKTQYLEHGAGAILGFLPGQERSGLAKVLKLLAETPGFIVPLCNQNGPRGVVSFLCNAFVPGDAAAVEIFASQVSLALDCARMTADAQSVDAYWRQQDDSLRRRTQELTMLHAVAADNMASHDLPRLLQMVVERAAHLLNGPGGCLYLYIPETDEVRCVVSYHTISDYTGRVLKAGQGAAGMVASTGKPLIVDDYRAWPNRIIVPDEATEEIAVLSVPMLRQGRVTGVLQVLDTVEGRRFSSDEAELLTLFADQAAIAIENSRLLEAEREAREQAEILQEVAQAVTASLDIEEVLHLILEQLKRVLVFDTSSVLLFGGKGKSALVAGIGYLDEKMTSKAAGDLLKDSAILQQMSRDLQPVVIGDVSQQPGWIWVPGAQHVCSFLGVPIIVRQRMTGALMVDNIQKDFFRERDIQIAQALAQQMAIAIENARLFEAERSQLLVAQTLKEVGALLTSQLGLSDVLENILDLLGRVIRYDSASIQLIGEDGRLDLTAGRGFPDMEIARGIVRRLSSQILKRGWSSGKAIVIQDTGADERWRQNESSDYIRSWIGAPLMVKGRLIGILNIDHCQAFAYDEMTAETGLAFANQAAAAIENARLFEAQEKRAAELEAVRQASLSLTSSLELEEVLDAILISTLRLLPDVYNAHIFLYHAADGGKLTFGSAMNMEGQRIDAFAQPRPNGLTYRVARSGEAIVVPDMRDHPLYDDIPVKGPEWNGSIVGLPLMIGRRVVGVMNISYMQPRQFSEAELHLQRLLGDHAAIAIENARLFQQAAAERRHLSLLYDLGRELAISLDSDMILDHAISLTCEALGGSMGEAFLYIPDEEHLSLRALWGKDNISLVEMDARLKFGIGSGLAGWVAQTRRAVYVPDVSEDPYWRPEPGLDDEAVSVIAAPIMEENRLLGVLSVINRRLGAFTNDHLELLQAICQQVGLALSNAERYQQIQSLVDLLASEQFRLESLIERLPVGVLLLDEEYRLLVANPLGREILAVLAPVDLGDVVTGLGDCPVSELIGRYNDSYPVEITRQGDVKKIFEAQACLIGGESRQVVLTVREVTRERENQMRVQMQERLATVGQLAAGIAHDFNNIMAAIMVYTDLLMHDLSFSPGSRERVTVIQQQIQRASSLIRQILDFSRRSVMEQSSLDLLPFLKELDRLLQRVLPENIHIELKYDAGIYMVNADPTRLQQVFMNLALNARDAMPDGGDLIFELG